MTRCSVPMCSDTANHHFPRDAKLRKQWLKAIRREDFVPKNGARICRKHFHESDYVKISDYTGRELQHRFLKKSAVPSIFHWTLNPDTKFIAVRERRRTGRRHRRHLVQDVPSTSKKSDRMHRVHKHHGDRARNNVSRKLELTFHKTLGPRSPVHVPLAINRTSQGTQTSNSLRLFATEQLLSDNESVYFYTGLDTYAQFTLLLSTLLPMAHEIRYRSSRVTRLSIDDQFLILLIKLRRSKPDFEIGKMFGVNKADVTNIIITWVSFVCDNWRLFDFWPNQGLVNLYMPSCFRENSQSNGVVIETTEVPIAKGNQCNALKISFSQYRHKNALKFLAVSPSKGLITYSSELEAQDVSASINQINEKSQMSNVLTNLDQNLANSVSVEQLISSTKTYKILACALNQSYAPLSSKIFSICVMICWFKEGIVNKDKL